MVDNRISSKDGFISTTGDMDKKEIGFPNGLCGIEGKSPNASFAIELVGTPEKMRVVVLGLPVCVDGEYNSPVKTKGTPQRGLSKNLFGTPPNKDVVELCEEMNLIVLGLPVNGSNSKEKNSLLPGGKKNSLRKRTPCENREGPRRSVEKKKREDKKKMTGKKIPGKKMTGKKITGKKITGKNDDEFVKMRRKLRYLLSRIQFEQNLLDAYSSEGWRGQSVEKLRPEKELERAKGEINCTKLKIRDLFQRLDSLACEGKFPDSLFDSDGLIDSEDIFCAKCGTKDSAIDNDIILCDGACDRGFHQCCLDPPLRTEEIPSDEEGWLCPACDCKVDCLDLVNDLYGTKLCVEDSWEEIFPEVATTQTAAGSEHDPMTDLPSDDSEDTDFNPDKTDDDKDDDEEVKDREGNSSSSDSSDFSSASEDLGEINFPDKDVMGKKFPNDPYLGLPSDESDDDDYNPDVANVDDDDDDDDDVAVNDVSGDDVAGDDVAGDDVAHLDLLEEDGEVGEVLSVFGRRRVERLDYKKLYDETYGNACSDSSDDEEWTDIDTSKKKKKADIDNNVSAGPTKKSGRTNPTNGQASNGSSTPVKNSSPNVGSTGKKRSHSKIGELATKKLHEAFEKNKYPDRDMKEKLAKEVGLTAKQVTKWFENARVGAGPARKRGRTKANDEAINDSPLSGEIFSPNTGESTGKKGPHSKIGEFARQKLHESFKNNRYPDRDAKEKLAKEAGLTTKQVTKWFDNARWSFNHHRSKMEATMRTFASNGNTSPNNVARDKTDTSSPNTSASISKKNGHVKDGIDTVKDKGTTKGKKLVSSSKNDRAKSSKVGTDGGDERTSTPRRSSRLIKTDDDQSNPKSGTHKDTSSIRKRSRG